MAHSTERCHKGVNDKRAAQMCTRHLGGHNLTKLIRAPSNETARLDRAWSGALTRCNTAHPTEQCHKGENGKWATQMSTRHSGGHHLAKLIWAPSNEMPRPEHTRLGDLTRRDKARLTERCHKGANRKWATQMCTRHPGNHNLTKLIRVPSNKMARPERARSDDLTRRDTTHPTEQCHKKIGRAHV